MEDMTGQGMAQVCKSEGCGKPFFFFFTGQELEGSTQLSL